MHDSPLFDAALIETFRQRAWRDRHVSRADFLLQSATEDLVERLASVDRHFPSSIDLHGHNGLVEQALYESGKVDHVKRIETDPIWLENSKDGHLSPRDGLQLPEKSAHLIVSILSLHLVNDIPAVLRQIRQALHPDGLFLCALPGVGTLGELREAFYQAETEIYGGISPRVAPFMEVRDGGRLLQQAGFAMPVTDVENLTVRYNNLFDLMRDIRAMGMQNALSARSKKPVSKRFFMRAAEIYAERFSDPDGRIRASFSFVWMSGWAPDPTQQKPMRPGSAQVSLADALKKM